MLHQIGVGALGPVFRTYEPARDRLVAVKVFRLDITPEQSQALANELSRAADVGLFHPSIVEPLAAGVEGTAAYRAEEYVAAESLDVAMRHYAPASMDKALPFITQLAGAIDFARAVNIGHGALHPRDIFVTPDEARATGFGVVEALERVGLRAPVRRPYSAPERINATAWSTPADVFSLAAIAYELLTGRRPAGNGEAIGPLAGDNVGALAQPIRSVLVRATDDDPARRYPAALAFASALEAAARGQHATSGAAEVSAVAVASPPPAADDRSEPRTPENEPTIEDERDADVAHFALARAEQEAEDASPSLFPDDTDEAAADRLAPLLASEGAAPYAAAQRSDPKRSSPMEDLLDQSPPTYVDEEDLVGENVRKTPVEEDHDLMASSAAAPSMFSHEPPRSSTLPLVITLIVGLGLGFATGYALWGRQQRPTTAAAASQQQPSSSQPSPAQPASKEWSEQAVKPPPRAATAQQPSGVAPPVPGDIPPARRTAAGEAPRAAPRPVPTATTGTLVVRSTPSGAGVTVDGRWRGRTPLTLERLPFARYTVRVVQPGYAVGREETALSAADASRTLVFRLEPQRAAGRRQGVPSTAPPPAAGARQGVPSTVRPPAAARRQPDEPVSYTGTVYVASRPTGARVFIDGTPVGTTPVRVPEVRVGSHVVRMELADHRPWTVSTRVSAGKVTPVTGSLERIQ